MPCRVMPLFATAGRQIIIQTQRDLGQRQGSGSRMQANRILKRLPDGAARTLPGTISILRHTDTVAHESCRAV